MNKKLMIAGAIALTVAFGAFARPHFGPGPGPRFHHGPYPRYHGGFWGRGGCNFWPGFVGGVVGSAVYDAVTYPRYASSVVVTPAPVVVPAQPVVVQQPVVMQQQPVVQSVWVEGRYVDQVQANGTVVRVWQPGHYVQSTTVVQ